ncbi:MAG: DUF1385 domain-containing protein [Armatimonadota bacterium]
MPKGEYLQYGGQAVIEGVMMRSPKYFAIACRAPDGRIVVHSEPVTKTWVGRQRWLKLPFLRGTFALLDAMALGVRALNFAAQVQLQDEQKAEDGNGEPPAAAESDGEPLRSDEGSEILHARGDEGGSSLMKAGVAGAMIAGLAIGVFLFVMLPVWVSQPIRSELKVSVIGTNIVEGIIKACIFLGYIALIGQMKEVREIFKYHGAEHKAINAMEAGQELTLENARAQTRLHPRCGTSFAIIVLILSIIVFTFLPREYGMSTTFLDTIVRIGLKLIVVPLIAGVSYEAIRIAGKFRSQAWVKWAFAPGLATQYLTTREPRDDQVEVALVALRTVLQREGEAERAEAEETPESAEPEERTPTH